MEKSTFLLEQELAKQGYDFVIGTDEVGRGPLCGPVVAAAVCLRDSQRYPHLSGVPDILSLEGRGGLEGNSLKWDLVRDSKKLSEKQREDIFDFIGENFHIGIGLCDHNTIDRINIQEASFLAMKKAIQELQRNIEKSTNQKLKTKNQIILVDGNKTIPNFSMEQRAIVGGDKIVKSISAASIIAKVTRDRMMLEMHEKYPQYGFDKHKGYGTKLHMDMLDIHGPCPIHRKSFAPVKKSLRQANQTV